MKDQFSILLDVEVYFSIRLCLFDIEIENNSATIWREYLEFGEDVEGPCHLVANCATP
jgi:hypothetical protein